MGRILGRICTTLGLEPERVWMMEWADIASLYRYWREAPPVHELVAGYLGFRPSKGRDSSRETRPDIGMTADEIRQGFAMGTPEPIGVR